MNVKKVYRRVRVYGKWCRDVEIKKELGIEDEVFYLGVQFDLVVFFMEIRSYRRKGNLR